MDKDEIKKAVDKTIEDFYPALLTLGLELDKKQADKFFKWLDNKIQVETKKAEVIGMEKAKSRVLRRTEIPKDAREPTRDAVVILGEEIADIIQRDIAELQKSEGEG